MPRDHHLLSTPMATMKGHPADHQHQNYDNAVFGSPVLVDEYSEKNICLNYFRLSIQLCILF